MHIGLRVPQPIPNILEAQLLVPPHLPVRLASRHNDLLLPFRQEVAAARRVGQEEVHNRDHQQGRRALDEEEELPVLHRGVLDGREAVSERAGVGGGDGGCAEVEALAEADLAAAVEHREVVRHARGESRFGHSQEHANDHQASIALDGGLAERERAPAQREERHKVARLERLPQERAGLADDVADLKKKSVSEGDMYQGPPGGPT